MAAVTLGSSDSVNNSSVPVCKGTRDVTQPGGRRVEMQGRSVELSRIVTIDRQRQERDSPHPLRVLVDQLGLHHIKVRSGMEW